MGFFAYLKCCRGAFQITLLHVPLFLRAPEEQFKALLQISKTNPWFTPFLLASICRQLIFEWPPWGPIAQEWLNCRMQVAGCEFCRLWDVKLQVMGSKFCRLLVVNFVGRRLWNYRLQILQVAKLWVASYKIKICSLSRKRVAHTHEWIRVLTFLNG